MKIVEGEGIHFCDQKKCLENRRFAIRNNTQFECSHIEKVNQAITDNAITPVYVLLHEIYFSGIYYCFAGQRVMILRQSKLKLTPCLQMQRMIFLCTLSQLLSSW